VVTSAFTELEIDTAGQNRGLWARRVVITLFCAVAALALADRFGQRTTESQAAGAGARMTLTAPETVRGGLFFQSRVEIHALREIRYPHIVLDDGWIEGMQVNSIHPEPTGELSRDGRLVLTYDKLAPGEVLRIWFQFEVDPTNTGHRSYGIELDDEAARVVRLSPTITVLP
jgi:hypothetical protein